jgi:protease-4
VNTIQLAKYAKVPEPKTKGKLKDKIAVIYAAGSIVDGKGTDANIGGSSLAETIREARLASSIRAIVLRVNSPGGSAIASALIWREAALAGEVKPLVVSMGNVAASGGYYISSPATTIICNPTTITGSIGVFGLIPNAGRLMHEKIGLSSEVVKTNAHADAPSLTRPLTSFEEQTILNLIERTYSTFVGHVSEGRSMTREAVDEIGQGRVWSGAEALVNGLADQAGGLTFAIEEAARLAEIEKYSIMELPELTDPYTKLLKDITGEARIRFIERELVILSEYIDQLQELSQLSGIQARLPYILNIR